MASTNQDAPTVTATSFVNRNGPISTGLSAQARTPYYATAYFSPFYFYGGSATSSTTGSTPTPGRDSAYYDALVALLESIGTFDAVVFGDPTGGPAAGADTHPLAIVTPKGWEEADDTDPVLWVRRVTFTIRIVVQVDDADAPFNQLDRLATAAQSRINRADLGGESLAALTSIRAGRYGTSSTYPEWSIDLDGEFTVLIDS